MFHINMGNTAMLVASEGGGREAQPENFLTEIFLSGSRTFCKILMSLLKAFLINTFTAIVDLSRFNNSCLKSPTSTLVDLTFQSRALRSFSLNQLSSLSL